jgi:hypothetical protein
MKHIALIAALSCATPALAEGENQMHEGLGQLSEGSRLLMEGLLGELAPLMEDLEGLGTEMLPLMESLRKQLGDAFEGLNAYHAPEVLPNGDIILRKKETAPPPNQEEAPVDTPIEL